MKETEFNHLKAEPEYPEPTFLRWLDERWTWYDRLQAFIKRRKARQAAKRIAYIRRAIEDPDYNDIRRGMMWAESQLWERDGNKKLAKMFRKKADWYSKKTI